MAHVAMWKARLASLPEKLSFSRFPIDSNTVFHATELSFAFTNLKPVIPGHVLVSPFRVVDRLALLSTAEIDDLFRSAKLVGDAILKAHPHADSLTYTVQDGSSAGQSVAHVHVHIMPRWAGDPFNASKAGNDAIYNAIDRSDQIVAEAHVRVDSKPALQARTPDEMIKEGLMLRGVMEAILPDPALT
jgi:bis(5'-adenosyl)-triphosphatase